MILKPIPISKDRALVNREVSLRKSFIVSTTGIIEEYQYDLKPLPHK